METQQKKVISFDELLSRAAASDLAQKFPISSNYYFMLLSRHIVELSKKKIYLKKLFINLFLIIFYYLKVLKKKE